ncbi:MAG: hypothetical protein AAF752_12020 [Bacteroidota bacterium]
MRHCLLLLALIFFAAGCDNFGEDGGTFPVNATVTLTHQFTAVGSTGSITITSDDEANLTSTLNGRGFAPADVETAEVTSAKIEVLFPLSAPVSAFSEAIVSLDASGLSALEVANLTDVPSGANVDEADLNVPANRDIAAFIRSPEFQTVLRLEGVALEAGETYEIAVELDIRMEVVADEM